MPDFEAGHLVQLYWEPDPVGAAGTLAVVGNITSGDLESGSSSETTEITIRGKKIDSYFVSPVMKREPWSFTVTLLPGDTQQDDLRDAYIAKTTHAWKQQGVDPSGNPSGAYEVVSGALISYKRISPYGAAPVRVEMQIRPSGPSIIDGTTIGT